MGRSALSRGGFAAALVLIAIYVLLGGDLPSSDDDTTTTSAPPPQTTTEAEEVPVPDGPSPEAGGPFSHDQDGTTFQNREGLLPQQSEGYYKEYTCETPGSEDRGARRLVIGSGGETYYTADHYGSFTRIDPQDYR